MAHRYHCDLCGTDSHELSSPAEVAQMLAAHMQVRHSSVTRSDPPRVTGRTGGRTRRR
ncbi:hypothetical protein FMEAI12_2220002 [Parafrankia sp. Ea1.12]|uniref:hypothetical protein n=1 Tax=Parafrankia sp. Ea1.12 TaxID=573499 RepID=UPI000DA56F36|nr:hypothetical protein [Parafrankia sp. Ea1.12]SQD94063.1 hypothetical protein FMEAI12_2220002 [Parafrankia sp. Ea1.12]